MSILLSITTQRQILFNFDLEATMRLKIFIEIVQIKSNSYV